MFKHFVGIYRAIGSPSFEDGEQLFINCSITPELQLAIDVYNSSQEKFKNLEFEFHENNTVEFDFEVPSYVTGAIFRDVNHFLENTPSLVKGKIRDNFYIVSLDYFSGDEKVPEEIFKIKRIAEFIKCLREFVALSIDREQSMNGDRIFFLKPSDGKTPQKAAALKINLTPDTIANNIGSFKILAALKKALEEEKTQIEERILLMNTAIAQIIDECEDDEADFEYLVRNWNKVNKKYLHDLHAYVSAFSFDSVKKKISDGLIESTTKINNAIGEVATKLLAVPASLGALILVSNSTSTSSFVVGVLGVMVASLIILRTIWHYKNQVKNLADSFAFNMREATKAKKTFSRSIQEEVNRIDAFQKRQRESIRFSFIFYNTVASLPIIGCLYYVAQALWPVVLDKYSIYKYCIIFNSTSI